MKVYMATTNSPIQNGDVIGINTNSTYTDVIKDGKVFVFVNTEVKFHCETGNPADSFMEFSGFYRPNQEDVYIRIVFWISFL